MKKTRLRVAVIGAGPAGLMAAEQLAAAGHSVHVFDAMPSPGRKFLLAGVGGLNLTHAEAPETFLARYGARSELMRSPVETFGSPAIREWAAGLGIETFVGSSGKVFPDGMKAAPLLRAWLHRLRAAGVRLHVRHRWRGWGNAGAAPTRDLRFQTPEGEHRFDTDALVLALGGASWSRLGSDGAWVPWLAGRGIRVAPLRPANCGFDAAGPAGTGWSAHFRTRFAGQPVKNVAARVVDPAGVAFERSGECLITSTGIEGGLIYALSAPLRDAIEASGEATLYLDLAPARSEERLRIELARPRGTRSFASHLQGKTGIDGVKAGLLRECANPDELSDPARLAARIKALPLHLAAPRPLDEAISTAGGVCFEELDAGLMLRALPGVFCCGEMLDWEAPTGGYLLTGCLATGRVAGLGAARWLAETSD
jgi:uncharacterized flavoprotein (TIGR03862 family)